MTRTLISSKKVVLLFKWAATLTVLAGVYYLGVLSGIPATAPSLPTASEHDGHDMQEAATIWTCAMHPQIQLPEPGACPLCGMDLIPLTQDVDENQPRRLVMSPSDKKLAEIETARVERKFVEAKIRMVGNIEYDETRIKTISSYVPGRIDRLYVDYTGIEVRKGDHLAEIYSPELLTAQEELLEANRRVAKSVNESSEFLRGSDQRALESAREKLRLYGFSDEQIRTIEEREEPEDHMLINAPLGGIVVHKSLNEGDYVKTGTPVYTVADLTKVWVKLDAYESDISWLHFGQSVDIQAEAYPGEHFDGVIAFIDPVLDPATRTVKIRVNVDNSDGRLKPGLFVRATVRSKIAKGGHIMDPGLAGKWIGPMHPEIVRDGPGDCPICGMALLKAEDLGYVSAENEEAKPIVVPATAVLKTGRRAVVYVAVPDAERPTYEGRVVVLGARAGDYYLVLSGLEEGERVVVNGAFNIDSALQIKAKPSMLSMEGESPEEGGDIGSMRTALMPVYDAYLGTQQHLANDDLDGAKKSFMHVGHLVSGIDMTLLSGETHGFWMGTSRRLTKAAGDLTEANDLDAARAAFALASKSMIEIERRFGHMGMEAHIEIHCPMAFDTGASWLQLGKTTANPFFGEAMLDCGKITNEYEAQKMKASAGASGHQH